MRVSSDRVAWARSVAEQYMPALGRRWRHVQAVASLADSLPLQEGPKETLVAAAYVHDIGYADELALTGFHPLDGARFLHSVGQEDLARLVAHHSNARHESWLRGFEAYEEEFPYGATILDDALTFCDLATSPDGQRVSLEERVAELVERYGADHVTARAIVAGVPDFERARDEVRRLCAAAGVTV
jgi:hypothetical protein